MPIVPTVRYRNIRASIAFYTQVLDFVLVDQDNSLGDPSFVCLDRDDGWIHLSSHSGNGSFARAVAVILQEIDALFPTFPSALAPAIDCTTPASA